ncbi:SCO3242 family prenyltransferase [Dactylosporangium vinaceum]|uniref:SCO3242 family prenyltransferase n=2 Tax=Dactylosporangium vinaceum TaxID=53362 RepID=A0ABV5MMX5_9ACTN
MPGNLIAGAAAANNVRPRRWDMRALTKLVRAPAALSTPGDVIARTTAANNVRPRRWDMRALTELVRAPAALSVPGDVIAGAAAANDIRPRTAGLAGASVLLYWAGMAANDWADRDIDVKERPERPIPSGRISARAALALAAGLTGAAVVGAGLAGGRKALNIAVPLAATVWAYDLGARHPGVMAACRALNVLLGASGGDLKRAVWPAATVFAHTYTVTLLSGSEVDGATARLPKRTLAGTAAVAAAAGGAPVSAGLAGWYALQYGRPQLDAVREPSAANIRKSVGAGILHLPALQGALIARAGAPLLGLAVAAAAPLARRLARKVSPT